MKKTIKSLSAIFVLVFVLVCGSVTASAASIQNNGYKGISININVAPYTTLAAVPNWGQYAYTNSGCAWFATARTKELTGKNITTIYSGYSWWFSQYSTFGFSRGSTPRAKALACYANHVAVVEQVNGNTITVSTGGYRAGKSSTGYTAIYDTTRAALESGDAYTGAFYGYVYLGVGGSWKTGQTKQNLGSDFYGRIVNTGMNKALQVQNNGNVVLATKKNIKQQYFRFTRNSDGTYKIISAYNDLSLDVNGGGANKGALLSTYSYHGGGAQRWGIYGSASKYFLSADCTDCVVDVYNADTADGTKIWMYSKNDSVAQKYTIELVSAPSKPALTISESGKKSVFSWKKDSNATSYTLKLTKNGKTYKTYSKVKTTLKNNVYSYSVALPDGAYTAVLTAKNSYYSKKSATTSFSVSYNTAGSWTYAKKLPSGVTSKKYKIEYQNTYEKVSATSPGSGWTKGKLVKTVYENSGNTYASALPLATSKTCVLVDYYYYHFCGGSTGNNANFAQTGSYNHYDQVAKTNVKEASSHQDYDDSRYTYYKLTDKNGNNFYCSSSVTCDGSYGSHGARSCYWYKMYVYQNKKAVKYYTYTKTSAWTYEKDSAATSVKVRYKPIVAKPGKVSGVKVTATTTNSITLKWNKVSGASGYRIYQYNKKTKKYVALGSVSAKTLKVTIKKLSPGTTYQFYVKAYKKQDGITAYGSYSSAVKVSTKLAKVTLSSLKSSKKTQATVKWKEVTGAAKYEVQYSTSSKFITSKTATTGKTSSTTLKKLKSKKTYYVRVRGYKELSGKKVYSAWSSVKKVKVK